MERGRDAALLAEKLAQAFKEPIELDSLPFYVTLSIGSNLYPADGTDVATLVRNTDAAMCQAKEQGRDCFHFYTEDMTARALSQVSLEFLETALREALSRDQFVLYYQPQHDLTTGRIIGVESLIRWHHPTLGLVGP